MIGEYFSVMKDFLSRTRQDVSEQQSFGLVVLFGIFTTLLAVGLYGYLGIFSRYGSDDYCLSAFYFQKGSFVTWMIERYLQDSSRYTNILFIGLVDKLLGWYNVAILPGLMLALFVFGLYLFLNEIVQMASLHWSRFVTLFIAALVVYFSVAQAPNLYETLYWRAGMTSHFAPLVFLTFLGAFILHQIRAAEVRVPPLWILATCFIAAFIIGGFSEPPTALLITILVLGMCAVWFFGTPQFRRSNLSILAWSLVGSLLALAVLALAPANALRLGNAPPSLFDLIFKTLQYPSLFIIDTFRSLPLPTLISIILPAALFLGLNTLPPQADPTKTRSRIIFFMVAVLVLAYLLIAASFAPSVYGQSYPVPRARFAARVILTCALILEGALMGVWIANASMRFFQPKAVRRFAIIALMLLSLYPLRTAWHNFMDVPAYQNRALAWDLRDAKIRALQTEGVRDVVVPFLKKEVIQDLGDHTKFRLNRCAAAIYKVDLIIALSGRH